MKKKILFVLMSIICCTYSIAQIGTWKAYPAYHDITDIQPAGNIVYVLASNGLYAYNRNDNSVQTFDKSTVLSDVDIIHISYNRKARRLLIVYRNYNIDLLDINGNVTNIPDYSIKSMTGEKTVNSISMDAQYAYVSTGFGILKINMNNAEISDAYQLRQNIKATTVMQQNIYAVTDGRILKGDISKNLLDRNNWTVFANIHINKLFQINGKLIGMDNGKQYVINKDGTFSKLAQKEYTHASCNDGKIVLCDNKEFHVINNTTNHSTHQGSYNDVVYDASVQAFWAADNEGKLYILKPDAQQQLQPELVDIHIDAPQYNHFGDLLYTNNRLYSCSGGYTPLMEKNRPGCIQILDRNGHWSLFEDNLSSKTGHKYEDHISIDIDPTDVEHVAVGGKTGLYIFRNGKLDKHYTLDNSPLQSANEKNDKDKNYVLIESVKFDQKGNLWMLNSQARTVSLLELGKEWTSHHKPALMLDEERSLGAMCGLTFDSRGLLWFVNKHWQRPSLYCYKPSTDELRAYTAFTNNDGKPINVKYIQCVLEDLNHDIWIGTSMGPLVLRKTQIENNEDVVFEQIKVPRNDGTNLADYLLDGVHVMCMAMDGAGRKWFGTNSTGVYLIDKDDMTQLHHFTAENSKLLSNNIESIAINHESGEVFFGTNKGLCSYVSDASATSEEMTKDNVYAYPNPVEPDYTGPITVRGLSLDADVKIVTSNGVLVAQGKSNGGTFTWDGNDMNGNPVASGIYMVQTADQTGNKGTVCKIAIVR